ncbi:NAD(P)-dependent oxidoreductase [Leptospira yasudae]|uniref:NAD-dependent epimerase/dehydratase family protein n=1 Tax=Leptospira yasudae TaxID=2202201 RepID=UPI001C4E54C2|nr:NAD(P)-dependent oxidoreductase [Leptospira yasudae]MBW0434144.1 NAD(P)-dependent oxidoreductase [Leptospira yasudae]
MIDVLVSGSSGFIGKALVKKLRDQGLDVFELNRTFGEVELPNTWSKLPKVQALVHLANRTFVPDSWKDTYSFINTNVLGTQNALDFALKNEAKFIYISAYLYGKPSVLPISESHPILPNNPYALSKSLAEQLCEFYSKFKGMNVSILRLFNVYGPGQKENFLIPSIIEQVKKKTNVAVLDLKPKRDYVYLDDVLDSIQLSLSSKDGLNIYNIGSGISYSVGEVITIIQEIAGTNLPVLSGFQERKEEILDVVADITKAKRDLNWSPKWSFQSGIEQILNSSY